jgi:hypothetical protein
VSPELEAKSEHPSSHVFLKFRGKLKKDADIEPRPLMVATPYIGHQGFSMETELFFLTFFITRLGYTRLCSNLLLFRSTLSLTPIMVALKYLLKAGKSGLLLDMGEEEMGHDQPRSDCEAGIHVLDDVLLRLGVTIH